MTRRGQVVVALLVLSAVVWGWYSRSGEERAVRRQLDALEETVNESAPEGLASVGRAAQIGGFFTLDVVVDLGRGSAPIQGRDTVIALAARFQPRAEGHVLEIDDVTVDVDEGGSGAGVNLVATLVGRQDPSGGRATDARELQLRMIKSDGTWRIARVTAVDALRRE